MKQSETIDGAHNDTSAESPNQRTYRTSLLASPPRLVRHDGVRGPRRRWRGVIALIVTALSLIALIAIAGNILAPLSPAPTGFFATPAVSPIATQRAVNGQAASLPALLRQQATISYINGLVSRMSLDEEIGQMIMIGFSETQMDDKLAYEIQHYHVGSAIIYAFNIETGPTAGADLKAMTSAMQADATIPLLIATDQEGGGVNRMLAVVGPLSSASEMGATNNPAYVKQRGINDAATLANEGINLNLAPVVDVLQTSGGDIGARAFGGSPDKVTTMAGAYLDGLQQSGKVVGALKHFPGLGDVPVDPHETLYTLTRPLDQLNAIDWAPYRTLIAQGNVYAVMSTHVVVSAVDPTMPASLSYPVLTGILRDQLGFNGVIITDGIYMKALGAFSLDQIAVDAVLAGNDIICSTYSIDSIGEVVQAIKTALANGTLTKARIDASVRRILLLKLHLGLLPAPNFADARHA